MFLRGAIKRLKGRCGALGMISTLLAIIVPAKADRLSSDEISQELLAACDDRAASYGTYDRKIMTAVEELTAMGVFEEAEFHSVKIGFCGLRNVEGPAATTSCARDTILLDSGYAAKDKGLVLKATLAHEMKHYFQHREQKAKFGEGYCVSDQYAADKGWMEEEADAFGDDVAILFFAGREVEIKNECSVAVSIYLEADNPISTGDDALDFITAPPQTTISSPERAISKFFKLYAEAMPDRGRKQVWGNATMANRRMINGDLYGLETVTLPNSQRSTGPFQMILSCKPEQES